MQTIKWTEAERTYPEVNFFPDADGENTCPRCHGDGSVKQRNMATLSPSDTTYVSCPVCGGEGAVILHDDRYE